jgi:hypothetical protein
MIAVVMVVMVMYDGGDGGDGDDVSSGDNYGGDSEERVLAVMKI